MGIQGVNNVNSTTKAEMVPKGNNQKKLGNVVLTKEKTEQYIESESYLQNCKNRWYGFTGNHGPKATKEENAKYEKWQRLNHVVNNTDYIINSDGSVRFVFKDNLNVEDFKEVFGIGDGVLRDYLRTRHAAGIKNQTVHANYTHGAVSETEQRAIYNAGGNDATITYTDGYSETKGPKGGWFNRNKIVDHPDYTKMRLGPADNESLFTFGASFFDPHKD